MAELKNLTFVQGTAVTAPSLAELDVATPDGTVVARAVNVDYLATIGAGQQNNKTAVADPTVSDDDSAGYDEGSWWVRTDTSPRRYFVCVNPATGAAVWKRVVFTDDAINLTDATNSTSKDTGALILEGGLGVEQDVFIGGNLTVDGTTTTINTATLDVEDVNITINKGGNDASSEGAGLTVERTGTDGSIIYADATVTKFKIGALGSEVDAVDISSAQTLTTKTISNASNTLNGFTASRAIESTAGGALTSSAVTTTELGYVSGVTSAIQTQLNAKQGFTLVSVASNVTLTNNGIHLVSTAASRSLALPDPSTAGQIIIKDVTGSCRANNITITRFGSENIEGAAASYVLNSDFVTLHLVSDSTNWYAIE